MGKELSNSDLDRDLKRFNLRISVVAGIIGIVGSGIICMGFVWRIDSNQEQNTEAIQEIKEDVRDINERLDDTDVFKGTSQTEINNMKRQLDRIENNQEKILDLFLEKSD